MTAGTSAGPPQEGTWRDYWEQIDDAQHVFKVEAVDYVARVRRILGVDERTRVLDFGCGFGYTSIALAPSVASVAMWDASENVRRLAQKRAAGVANVGLVDLGGQCAPELQARFDLVLVHSVVQYMSTDELKAWLEKWRQMLAPGGRLVLSDLIVPGAGSPLELVSYLAFALRKGFFWNAFLKGMSETLNYWQARKARPLTAVSREELEAWAGDRRLAIEWSSENLSHRQTRATAILRPAH
jgi:cyclopropane fatty-acyl-phospholipid synthase-like methyltransferase